jgi:hypothetical protein
MEKNPIKSIFTNLTDDDLVLSIQEMKEDESLGVIRENGYVRNLCKQIHNFVGGNVYEHMIMVQVSLYKEASFRFTPTMDELTNNF